MATSIYKPGQGYYTRIISAIGFGLLVVMGAIWLSGQFSNTRIAGREPVYTQTIVFLIVVGFAAALAYWLIGRKPRVVDFMIATESEMKKVNWSNRREIVGSTWVVIGLTIFLSVLCFAFDFGFAWFFQQIGVLETR